MSEFICGAHAGGFEHQLLFPRSHLLLNRNLPEEYNSTPALGFTETTAKDWEETVLSLKVFT